MSISSILNAGVKGMAATQLATQVSANNIANAATVGYTRRTAVIEPDHALTSGMSSKRVVEPFIQKRLLSAEAGNGEATASRAALDVLDTVFAEGDGTLGTALDDFQVSMQDLTARPQDIATRQQVLANASNLSTAFMNAAAQIDSARADASMRISDDVAQVNQRLHQIAGLGGQIQQAEVNGIEASDLRDRRDLLIREVAGRVPVSTIDHGNGQMTLVLGGSQPLVSVDGKVSELSVTTTGDDEEPRLSMVAAGATIDVTAQVKSGSIGGALSARSGALKQAKDRLDALAYDITNKYNEVHAQGVTLNRTSGLKLFTSSESSTDAAKRFSLSAEIAGQPENIAAASDQDALPSDNRNAIKLADLATQALKVGGKSATEELASLVGFAGSAVQTASQAESFASGALEQIKSLHDNASGVSTDEEMVQIMKYQRAYQASLKVIQVADQMLSDLLQLRG